MTTVQRLRRWAHLSRAELAAKVGMTANDIADIETEKKPCPEFKLAAVSEACRSTREKAGQTCHGPGIDDVDGWTDPDDAEAAPAVKPAVKPKAKAKAEAESK